MAMTRDCKSLAFGLRRFESYLQHHRNKRSPLGLILFLLSLGQDENHRFGRRRRRVKILNEFKIFRGDARRIVLRISEKQVSYLQHHKK